MGPTLGLTLLISLLFSMKLITRMHPNHDQPQGFFCSYSFSISQDLGQRFSSVETRFYNHFISSTNLIH